MSDLDRARRSISATVDDIARIQKELGPSLTAQFRQPDDREAFDIIARIERRLKAAEPARTKKGKAAAPAAAA